MVVAILVGRHRNSSARTIDSENNVRAEVGSGRDVDRRLGSSSQTLSRPGLLVIVVKLDMQSSSE